MGGRENKERREARSGAGERGPGYGPCRPHPTPGDFLPSLFLITSPWQPISPSSSAPAPLPSPWRFWGAFSPPSSTSSHPNFPLRAHLSPHPQRLPAPSGDLQGCSSAPSCSRAWGGHFQDPPTPLKGEGSGWSTHGAAGGAQLLSPAPGAPSTSPSQRGHTKHLGSTHGSSAAGLSLTKPQGAG